MKIHRVALLVFGTMPRSTRAGFASMSPPFARRLGSRRVSSSLSAHRGSESTERKHHVHHADTTTSSGYAPKRRSKPWRSVISRVLPNQRKQTSTDGSTTTSSSSVMHMKRLEDDSVVIAHPMNDTTSFILRSFQETSPMEVFANIDLDGQSRENDFASLMNRKAQKKRLTLDGTSSSLPKDIIMGEPSISLTSSLPISIAATSAVNPAGIESSNNKDYEGGSPLTRVARIWFQNVLHGLLCRWAVEPPEALRVRVAPRGNVLGRLLVRGQIRLNAEVDFDRLVFPNICLSGGKIAAKRMTLNLWSFAPNSVRFSIPRYQSQFEISATNCTFTQADLLKSSCIRNGLRNLLIRILQGRGVRPSDVVVNSLDILPNGKLSCRGQATSLFGAPIHFEVRSGISLASRGHVLTFPGLEISLGNPYLFVPVVPEVDLDIGHNARIRDILIDGSQRLVRMSASATICPKHTIKLSQYIQSTGAYSALFSVDVGKWLTQIGRFTH